MPLLNAVLVALTSRSKNAPAKMKSQLLAKIQEMEQRQSHPTQESNVLLFLGECNM